MPDQKNNISDSEYEIIKVLWNAEKKLTVSEVLSRLTDKNWKTTTVATLLNRLVAKGAASYEKKGNVHHYYPIVEEKAYNMQETKSLLSKIYNGSVKNLVASLYENQELSEEDVSDLKKMFDLE